MRLNKSFQVSYISGLPSAEGSFFFLRSIVLLCCICCFERSGAQEQPGNALNNCYRRVIDALTADSLEGRLAGTQNEVKAADLLKREFKELSNFRPAAQKFSYRMGDTGRLKTGENIYCYIDNGADSTVLIGAHYDHIGMGGVMARDFGRIGPHPGADDNASGVALLIGLVTRYNTWASKKYNYLFVSYAAHEVGLYGSASFCRYCKGHFKPLCRVLNFDMVGRFDESERAVTVYGSLASRLINAPAAARLGVKIFADEPEKLVDTDCRSFVLDGVDCLSFTTGLHDDYHKITDTPSKINYSGIWLIQQFAEQLLRNM